MHGSGLVVSDTCRSQFARLSGDPSTLYIEFGINDETFAVRSMGRKTDSREGDFATMQAVLGAHPTFIVARAAVGAEDKWSLIFYMPDGSTVKDRMVYAASTAALRQGLGQGMFSPQVFSITHKNELSVSSFDNSLSSSSSSSSIQSLMTREERLRDENEVAAAMSMSSVKVSAIVGLPVKADERAVQLLQNISQQKGQNTGIFLMHSEAEVLMVDRAGDFSLDDLHKVLPNNEPRYILHSFNHENPNGERAHTHVFVYYCPSAIAPKLKMFYSTCKSMVMKMCENFGCSSLKSIEISDPAGDLSVVSVLDDLYPKAEEKKTFDKPSRRGKGGAKFLGKGFQS